MTTKKISLTIPCLARLTSILLLGACGACSSVQENLEPVFFPAPPAEPRIQFLKSYGGPSDIEKPNWFVTFITGAAPRKLGFMKPYGIAAGPEKVYLTDSLQGFVRRIDLAKQKVETLPRKRGVNYRKPINISLDKSGNIYIADTVGDAVFGLRPDGSLLSVIGAAEGIKKPTDVAVRAGRVYVVDIEDKAVKVFDQKTGKQLLRIPGEGDKAEARFSKPINLALDSKGNIYVVDALRFRVQKYSPKGEFIGTIGKHGDKPGEFARPKGIAIDREDRIYVVDAMPMVVQIFDRQGRILAYFGEPASQHASLRLPAQVIIDYDNVEYFRQYQAEDFDVEFLIWVTSQYGERKICVYGFGHRK